MQETCFDQAELPSRWTISPRTLERWGWAGEPPFMKRPNPLPPDRITPTERHAELCNLLALGLVRSRMRDDP